MPEENKFAYTTVPGKLRQLLVKIPTLGKPGKVTTAWLKSVGFTSSNDPTILPVLRFVGLLDKSSPTTTWDALRGNDKVSFASAVRAAYAELFAIYPDADRKDAEALRNFFRTNSSGGEQVQGKLVQTFQVLVEFGNFEDSASKVVPAEPERLTTGASRAPTADAGRRPTGDSKGVKLTVNIQLQLPATEDGRIYDQLFGAMRKHLIDLVDGSDQ